MNVFSMVNISNINKNFPFYIFQSILALAFIVIHLFNSIGWWNIDSYSDFVNNKEENTSIVL